MGLLERIDSPQDLKALPEESLPELAEEIRDFLVSRVSATGGHLGPNLGVVELTMALHRVFDSPDDVLLFDTGHQSYVHKILTGRRDSFDRLRQQDGLSGYPSRAESPHDVIENSHASTVLSWADGIAKAFQRTGRLDDRAVVGRDRRRRADRRHGLGGAEQHRRRTRPPGRRRRQRQRAVVLADDRRARAPPGDAPDRALLRAGAAVGQGHARPHPGGRSAGLRGAARDQEGDQGRRRPPGDVRGPRPEVRRAGRRPRRP